MNDLSQEKFYECVKTEAIKKRKKSINIWIIYCIKERFWFFFSRLQHARSGKWSLDFSRFWLWVIPVKCKWLVLWTHVVHARVGSFTIFQQNPGPLVLFLLIKKKKKKKKKKSVSDFYFAEPKLKYFWAFLILKMSLFHNNLK